MSKLRLADASDTYVSQEEIQAAITDLAAYYKKLFKGTAFTTLTVLHGAKPFAEVLLPLLSPSITQDEIKVSSMDGTTSTGRLHFNTQPKTDLTGKDVLVIEDLVDTGLTLSKLCRYLKEVQQVHSLHVVSLFEKPDCRMPDTIIPNLKTGIQIANKFVIGFGLDWNERYRELPYLTLAEETHPGYWEPIPLQAT